MPNNSGTTTATSDNPQTLLEGPAKIETISLYNPNGTAAAFVLRYITRDKANHEIPVTRVDDSIAATDSWERGLLSGQWRLNQGQRLEIILDSSPTTPIEWSVDYEV